MGYFNQYSSEYHKQGNQKCIMHAAKHRLLAFPEIFDGSEDLVLKEIKNIFNLASM